MLVLGFFISAFVAHPEANGNEMDLFICSNHREGVFLPALGS